MFLIFYNPKKESQINNQENNIVNDNDETLSLVSKRSNSYLYKYYPNIND